MCQCQIIGGPHEEEKMRFFKKVGEIFIEIEESKIKEGDLLKTNRGGMDIHPCGGLPVAWTADALWLIVKTKPQVIMQLIDNGVKPPDYES